MGNNQTNCAVNTIEFLAAATKNRSGLEFKGFRAENISTPQKLPALRTRRLTGVTLHHYEDHYFFILIFLFNYKMLYSARKMYLAHG
jgi:hypothetical protein